MATIRTPLTKEELLEEIGVYMADTGYSRINSIIYVNYFVVKNIKRVRNAQFTALVHDVLKEQRIELLTLARAKELLQDDNTEIPVAEKDEIRNTLTGLIYALEGKKYSLTKEPVVGSTVAEPTDAPSTVASPISESNKEEKGDVLNMTKKTTTIKPISKSDAVEIIDGIMKNVDLKLAARKMEIRTHFNTYLELLDSSATISASVKETVRKDINEALKEVNMQLVSSKVVDQVSGTHTHAEEEEIKDAFNTGKESAEKLDEKGLNRLYKAFNTTVSGVKARLTAIISELMLKKAKVTGFMKEQYEKLINKLMTIRVNAKEDYSKEDSTLLSKVCSAIIIGFVKTAEVLIGVSKFALDITVAVACFCGRVVRDTVDNTITLGKDLYGALDKDIISLFEKKAK